MDGARLPGRGPPFIIEPLPFIMGPPGPGWPRGNWAEESLGGGGGCMPFDGEGVDVATGLLRFVVLR